MTHKQFLDAVQTQLGTKFKRGYYGISFPSLLTPTFTTVDVVTYEPGIPRICVNYGSNAYRLPKRCVKEWGGVEREYLDYTLELSCTTRELPALATWVLPWVRYQEHAAVVLPPPLPVGVNREFYKDDRYIWTAAADDLYYKRHPELASA